nr:SPOR domain-containing protein [Nannocystis pusilla]
MRTSRFQPWIVRQRQGKGLYIVYVGGYSNREKALADFEAAKAVRREGGYVKFMPEDCPRLEWTQAGYHDCAR